MHLFCHQLDLFFVLEASLDTETTTLQLSASFSSLHETSLPQCHLLRRINKAAKPITNAHCQPQEAKNIRPQEKYPNPPVSILRARLINTTKCLTKDADNSQMLDRLLKNPDKARMLDRWLEAPAIEDVWSAEARLSSKDSSLSKM
jgi:hypothetical protein